MNLRAQQKLQTELDGALGIDQPSLESSRPLDSMHYGSAVATSDIIENLPYLEACINEGLSSHPTSAPGLPIRCPVGQ